ncbi:MAG: hypothetical protein ACQESP_01675 [Candidatus Muiribacteriota bacterium]
MNYLINDIANIIDDFSLFIRKKMLLKNHYSGFYFFFLAILNISVFLSMVYTGSANVLIKVLFIFISITIIYLIFSFLILGIIELLSKSFLKKSCSTFVLKLLNYAFFPFLFLVPVSYVFFDLSSKIIFFQLLILIWLHLIVLILSESYGRSYFEMLFFITGIIFFIPGAFFIGIVFLFVGVLA